MQLITLSNSFLDTSDISLALRYTLEYTEPSPSLNSIKEMHYKEYMRIRTVWKRRTLDALGDTPIVTINKAFIVVNRRCVGPGLDWDNAYGGLKPILDCIVTQSSKNPSGLGLVTDDSPKHMPYAPIVTQQSCKKSDRGLTLKIFEII